MALPVSVDQALYRNFCLADKQEGYQAFLDTIETLPPETLARLPDPTMEFKHKEGFFLHTLIMYARTDRQIELIKKLIDRLPRAALSHHDMSDGSPLHVCARHAQRKILPYLYSRLSEEQKCVRSFHNITAFQQALWNSSHQVPQDQDADNTVVCFIECGATRDDSVFGMRNEEGRRKIYRIYDEAHRFVEVTKRMREVLEDKMISDLLDITQSYLRSRDWEERKEE